MFSVLTVVRFVHYIYLNFYYDKYFVFDKLYMPMHHVDICTLSITSFFRTV